VPEFDIGASYALYTRYLHPVPGHPGRNLFDPAARTEFASDPWMTPATQKLSDLRTAGIVTDDADGTTLAPVRGLLVLPDSPPDGGTPVVLIVHGQAPTFHPSAATATNEVPSYRGYGYFQRHLASQGIASLSVNVNVVNKFSSPSSDDDHERRAQLLVLHLALLSALSTGSAPTATPLRVAQPGGTVTLAAALADTQSASLSSLRDLVQAVADAELDLTRLGVMGHSRGATTAAEFAERVRAAAGPASPPATFTPGGPPQVVLDQRANVEALIRTLGAPQPSHVKAVVPLEPDDVGPFPLSLPNVFLLAVAGSHDEDVHSSAANIYEGATCHKALLMLHGATHGRFNTVWRALPYTRQVINESIRCQAPAHIMSNAAHENVLRSFVGATFVGRLRNRPDELLILTGERRGPSGTDVTRSWRFPNPFTTPVVRLDGAITTVRVNGSAATPASTRLDDLVINRYRPFAQNVTVLRVARPARRPAELVVPIAADQLTDMTHLSVRLAKEYDVRNRRARTTEPLRNFELALYTDNGLRIGQTLSGSRVRSVVQRAYPVRKWTDRDGPPQCYDDTQIFFQTVEVPLDAFVRRTRHTASDLGRVRELRFGMLPVVKTGEDIFCLVDFLLTRR